MLNLIKFSIALFAAVAVTSFAQTSDDRSSTQRATKTAETTTMQLSTVEASEAQVKQKSRPSQSTPGSISAKPDTVLTLCCGSLDPHSMAGSNCAYMHTGQGCGGFILACPEGTKDTVKKDGSGYCKEGG